MSQEGKYVVTISEKVDKSSLKPNIRVALKKDSYELTRVLN